MKSSCLVKQLEIMSAAHAQRIYRNPGTKSISKARTNMNIKKHSLLSNCYSLLRRHIFWLKPHYEIVFYHNGESVLQFCSKYCSVLQ